MKTLRCSDLIKEIDSLLNDGYRLDMIMPADDPRVAIVSKGDERIRLSMEGNPQSEIRNAQSQGRAGMEYRDLIPDRLGGRVIASHIRITKGGDVSDYVHYHKIQFQMIYCKAGWIRVVYEDQGPSFVLNPGDCILQPPEIRHRVLESSAGAEVIEISSPAVHETWVEHDIELPTAKLNPGRDFVGQKFVRHIGESAEWTTTVDRASIRDTGIAAATNGLASACVIRISRGGTISSDLQASSDIFVFVLEGIIRIEPSADELFREESLVCSQGVNPSLEALADSEVLVVTLPRS